MNTPILSIEKLTVRFHGLVAVNNVSLEVQPGEFIGVIGPNGAGKTTLFNAISGFVPSAGGKLQFAGADMRNKPLHAFAKAGMARTFQTPRVFFDDTALENVSFAIEFSGNVDDRAMTASERTEHAKALLVRVGMQEDMHVMSANLPPARQRLLEVAMVLAARPRLLLLDEVAAGLTEAEVMQVAQLILGLRRELGFAVIWIEHAVNVLMQTVDRVVVLKFGQLIADGTPAEISSNAQVVDAYLGTSEEMAALKPIRIPSTSDKESVAMVVQGLSAGYRELRVLHELSFQAEAGKLTVLVGANGAGKTTLLKCLAGVLPAQNGRVLYDGQPITGHGVATRVRLGLSLVPEGRHLFPSMSVLENLELGGCLVSRQQRAEAMQWVLDRMPRLRERLRQTAGTMSGGEQQMVAIGRALMARPRMLMLDEPSLGLAPMAFQAMMDLLCELCADGITVLLVEQNVRQALSRADQGYVLERGRLVMQGTGLELLASDLIQRTYLGA